MAANNARAAITVGKPPEAVYAYWRDFTNLPTFMTHLESVTTDGPTASHWTAKAPIGTVEWDAEVTEDTPGRQIAWRSTGKARVPNSGRVAFTPAPGDRGTEVRVELTYDLPGGKAGELVARLFGENPQQQIDDDLRRFKQVLETGEVVVTEAVPGGVEASAQIGQHPAHAAD
jgi:uncharacterized membrane protein